MSYALVETATKKFGIDASKVEKFSIEQTSEGRFLLIRTDEETIIYSMKNSEYEIQQKFLIGSNLPRSKRESAIKNLKRKHRLTQEIIALIVGVSQSTVSRILNG